MSDRAILITGATGKVGVVLVEYLLAQGECVIAQSRSSSKLLNLARSFSGLPGTLETLCIDLMDDKRGHLPEAPWYQ